MSSAAVVIVALRVNLIHSYFTIRSLHHTRKLLHDSINLSPDKLKGEDLVVSHGYLIKSCDFFTD